MKVRQRCTNCRRYLELDRVPKKKSKLWEIDCSCCGYNHWEEVSMPDSLAVQPNIPMMNQTIEQLKEELAYWIKRDGKGPREYVRECREWIARKEAERG